jgi:hypothetical protein
LEFAMRRAVNFNPEWGYFAPAPSFLRTLRMIFVAAAVGATAGAAVVFSLVDRPAAEESVAARTLVVAEPEAVRVAPAVDEPAPPQRVQNQEIARPGVAAAAESGNAATLQRPAGIAGLAESPPSTALAPALARPVMGLSGTPPQTMPIRKPQLTWRSPAPQGGPAVRAPLALLPTHSARAVTGASPPRIVY